MSVTLLTGKQAVDSIRFLIGYLLKIEVNQTPQDFIQKIES